MLSSEKSLQNSEELNIRDLIEKSDLKQYKDFLVPMNLDLE